MRDLSIVIPAYNEEKRIGSTLQEISQYLSAFEYESEIIIVNDGSTDNTAPLVRRFMQSLDDMRRFKIQIILLNEKQNKGKGAALKRGMLEASGKYILFTDADNSTHIREIKNLLHFVETDYDIAIGSRSLKESKITNRQSYIRQTMGKIFNKIIRFTTVTGYIDTQCGFKLFRRHAARTIFSESAVNGFACDVEMLYIARKKKFKVIEVPIEWENHPDSRVSLIKSSLQMLMDLLRIRRIHS